MVLDLSPKKMAAGVLERAFKGGSAKSNFPARKAGDQEAPGLFGSPGNKSNFKAPDQEVQSYAEGGEVDEGRQVAAEEIIGAFEAKDAAKLSMALGSFFEQCMAQEAMEPEVE